MDSGNRFMVTPMKAPGLLVIREQMVTKPISKSEAVNLAMWLLCEAEPLVAYWLASKACDAQGHGREIQDFKATVKGIVAESLA